MISDDLDREFSLSQLVINPKSFKIFSITNPKIPKLKNCKIEERSVSVILNQKEVKISFYINRTIVDVFKDYPKINYNFLVNVEFSEECKNSLLPQLCKLIISKDTVNSIKNILSFVQESAEYKEDLDNYGFENPSTPEQALSCKFTDCEDRSVLFYYLIKSFYRYEILMLEYPNHINVGVAIPNYPKLEFLYDKKKFVICEPADMSKRTVLGSSSFFEKYPNPKVRIHYSKKDFVRNSFICAD